MKQINLKTSVKAAVSPETVSWLRRWGILTLVASLFVTAVDAALLQKKTGFLTGGFLSDIYLENTKALSGFLISSLICDAGIISLFMMLSFFLLRNWKARRQVWALTALLVSVFPMLVIDLVKYRLEVYIGDIFKLLFLFDLAGKNPMEFLAISYTQIFIWLMISASLIIFLIFVVRRVKNEGAEFLPPLTISGAVLLSPLVILAVSIVYSTVVRLGSEQLDYSLRRKPSGLIMGFIVNRLSDFDGDGYGLLSKPADPAPFNPEIYPYAIDIPGNGVDENGVGGDLPLARSVYKENTPVSENWVIKPSIIFFMLESFRADLAGSQLDGKYVTPVINALGESGVSSKSAFSHNGYTSQSRYHSLTGEFPDNRKSIIHDFKKNKYFVAFFSAQDVSFGGNSLGFGFDDADISYDAKVEPHLRFNTFSTPGSISLSNKVMKKKVVDFLKSYSREKPLFLYVNFQDTHFPYWNRDILPILNNVKLGKSSILPGRKDELLLMYKNTAANVDSAIGEIVEQAKKALGGDVAVVILSDHGESLFDDGFLGHGHRLNDHQTQIPLIISGLPAVLEEPFGQVDLRSIINRALSGKDPSIVKPSILKSSQKRVFQYIGNLEKPGEIGFLSKKGRLLYNFRRGAVKEYGGEWKGPSELSESSRHDLNKLIYLWESMVLASQNGAAASL